jgi:hypothetical protein
MPAEKWLDQVTNEFENPLLITDRVDVVYVTKVSVEATGNKAIYLTDDVISDLCAAYFSLFYHLYPIVDRNHFYLEMLPRVCRESFSESDEASALVLLVLALGSVAQEGAGGRAVADPESGRDTGVRGGTIRNPPGLLFVNEAQRRMGILMTQHSLVLLQCYLHTA